MNRNVGQMFMIGFEGTAVAPDHPVVRDIRVEGLGGVILFDRNVDGSRQNISSPQQLRELTAALQGFAEVPLLIAVDQEGGKVCRLREEDDFPSTISALRLGEMDQLQTSIRYAEQMADVLSACGITVNLAPVVDLDLNPDNPIIARYERSYGQSPEGVLRQASVFIEAHHRHGIACCLKHFPGHGSAAGDSHLGFVDNTKQWRAEELEPYRCLIASGLADSVMTAHVINRKLDSAGLPATLSPGIISGLLRDEIGFDGVVVSDDLQMKAISDRWSYEEAVRMAVLAGVDILIVGNNLAREQDVVTRGINAIEDLVRSGQVSGERLDSSIARIATLKKKITGEIPWSANRPTVLP